MVNNIVNGLLALVVIAAILVVGRILIAFAAVAWPVLSVIFSIIIVAWCIGKLMHTYDDNREKYIEKVKAFTTSAKGKVKDALDKEKP